jgi:hypothetical protein
MSGTATALCKEAKKVMFERMSTTLDAVLKQSFTTHPPIPLPSEMSDLYLADLVITGFKKMKHFLPYIEELKFRFSRCSRDGSNRLTEPICGCYSWREFCEKHLDRTTQAVGKMVGRATRQKPVEVTGNLFDCFLRKVRPLSPFHGDGFLHVFESMAEEVLAAPIYTEDLETVETTIYMLREAAKTFLDYAERLDKNAEPVHTAAGEGADGPR